MRIGVAENDLRAGASELEGKTIFTVEVHHVMSFLCLIPHTFNRPEYIGVNMFKRLFRHFPRFSTETHFSLLRSLARSTNAGFPNPFRHSRTSISPICLRCS